MVCSDLRVHAPHHHRLDDGQEFRDGRCRNTKGCTKRKGCAHVPADYRARDDAQLATKAANKVPDLPTLKC